jgi:hypothetical protein
VISALFTEDMLPAPSSGRRLDADARHPWRAKPSIRNPL